MRELHVSSEDKPVITPTPTTILLCYSNALPPLPSPSAGKYSNDTGICQLCDAGWYVATKGASACIECE